jgi:glycosyltransferase involved in cell wall biosynthesis
MERRSEPKSMKILFVAMAESIHTARWINQINDQGWNIYLFPSHDLQTIHSDLKEVKICMPFFWLFNWFKKRGLSKYFSFFYTRITYLIVRKSPDYYAKRLNRYIKSIKPDIIHSMETQSGGFLVAKAKCEFKQESFPNWWHTNWGSDIFLFGRLPHQKPLIKRVMENCNYYSCECIRDIGLAIQFGFKGIAFDPYPNTGGFEPALMANYRKNSGPTSLRRIIMVKGYQGWAGRALVAIRALERCAGLIKDYKVVIYSNVSGEDVEIASTLLSQNTGAEVTILKAGTSHKEILKYHSLARISIGLSIGDAISTSLLEAMAMGSFPIQSCTACASEWFEDGNSGLIVPPEDPEVVEQAIRRALLDDNLVDSAAEINYKKIVQDANFENLKARSIQAYEKIINIDYVQ